MPASGLRSQIPSPSRRNDASAEVLHHPQHRPGRRAVRVGRVRLRPLLAVAGRVLVGAELDVERVLGLALDRLLPEVDEHLGRVDGFGGVPM
jgi:hypothetical protein